MAFPMQRQTQTLWCWAAVTASVDAFLSRGAGRTQCAVANLTLGGTGCCRSPASCNRTAALEVALGRAGLLAAAYDRALEFHEVKAEIVADRPVCARIVWAGGGGHFVVISGCRVSNRGVPLLTVGDPWYAPSNPVTYYDFRYGYLGSGRWRASYLVG